MGTTKPRTQQACVTVRIPASAGKTLKLFLKQVQNTCKKKGLAVNVT